jgi:hypothetical protein
MLSSKITLWAVDKTIKHDVLHDFNKEKNNAKDGKLFDVS